MPIVRDLKALIDNAANTPDILRTLILVDMTNRRTQWVQYCYPYDFNVSEESVRNLFDVTFTKLQTLPTEVVELPYESIPIVPYLGRFKVTIVAKKEDGTITIIDGQRASIDSYLGVGG